MVISHVLFYTQSTTVPVPVAHDKFFSLKSEGKNGTNEER